MVRVPRHAAAVEPATTPLRLNMSVAIDPRLLKSKIWNLWDKSTFYYFFSFFEFESNSAHMFTLHLKLIHSVIVFQSLGYPTLRPTPNGSNHNITQKEGPYGVPDILTHG